MENRLFERPDHVKDPLHVITVIFNPQRYKSRWALYKKFEKHIKDLGGVLHTVECSFGERDEVLTPENLSPKPDPGLINVHGYAAEHTYLKVRTTHELWLKENLINLAIQRLPSDWKYVAWIDADVIFCDPSVIGNTIQALQHHDFVQMWAESQDLGPDGLPFQRHKGFAYSFEQGYALPTQMQNMYYDKPKKEGPLDFSIYHSGYAWAATRRAINAVGGLIETAILGAADMHQCQALLHNASKSFHPSISDSYKRPILEWEERCKKYIRKNIGYTSNLLLHGWHGSKKSRRYYDRWQILLKNSFNIETDLKKDWQGVYQLVDNGSDRSISLRDDIRDYFRGRNEDSIDMDPNEDRMNSK